MKTIKILTILSLLIIAASIYNCKNASDEFFENGYREYETGNYEKAIEFFTKAIELNPRLKGELIPRIKEAKEKLE